VRVTPTVLTRFAALAAVTAGVVFVAVQVNHPPLSAEMLTTTEMAIRGSLKVVMAGLALVGITGMYLRQVQEAGVLGLIGYLTFAIGYLLILSTAFASAVVLPSVAATDPGYVNDALAAATGNMPDGDIGLWGPALQIQGAAFLAGGLLFGVALYRARVLVRWASVLLAVSGLMTVALSVMPDALYRLLAWPNGIAMAALGVSLWRSTRPSGPTDDLRVALDRTAVDAR
jgi:hypothetical protein